MNYYLLTIKATSANVKSILKQEGADNSTIENVDESVYLPNGELHPVCILEVAGNVSALMFREVFKAHSIQCSIKPIGNSAPVSDVKVLAL